MDLATSSGWNSELFSVFHDGSTCDGHTSVTKKIRDLLITVRLGRILGVDDLANHLLDGLPAHVLS